MKRTFTQKGLITPPVVRSMCMAVFLCIAAVTQINAQCSTHCSISCYPTVNVTLNSGSCEAVVTPSMVSNAISLACESEYAVELRDEDNQIIPNATLTKQHVGKKVSFHLSNIVLGCGNFCWGDVNVENKNIPVPLTDTVSGMCGATELEYTSLKDLAEWLETTCTVPVSDLTESYEKFGDKCIGETTVRTVRGNANIDGNRKVIVSIQTRILTPMDTSMVNCPGSPDFNDALELDCRDTDAYPSPEVIAELFHDTLAYPWVNKGKIETRRDTFIVVDSIRNDTMPRKIELPDGTWAIFDVINKTTVYKDSIVVDSTTQYVTILPGQKDCNITAKYEDWTYEGCAGPASKIMREWTILDWCTGEFKMCEQWIVITDKTAPWIDVPDYVVKVDAAPWTCKGSVDLSNYYEVKGFCTDPHIQLRSSDGLLTGTILSEIMITDSPIRVELQATNNCGVDAYAYINIKVADRSAPVAIAKDELTVTLTSDPYLNEIGVAKIEVGAVDGGSHDSGCGEVTSCILLKEELADPVIFDDEHLTDRNGNLIYHQHQCGDPDGVYEIYEYSKNDSTLILEIPYVICKDYVKFCCKDVPMQQVALVVSDESTHSPDGYSWSDVIIEDKSTPIIVCEDLQVECGYSIHPDDIGYPTIYDPICVTDTVRWVDDEDLDACGNGAILRMWFYGDQVLCIQRITQYVKEVFDPSLIKWPLHHDGDRYEGVSRECEVVRDGNGDPVYDYEYDDYGKAIDSTIVKAIFERPEIIDMYDPFECGVTDDTGVPTWCNETCGLIAYSYEDYQSEAGEACKKIIRKWTIIDWCAWVPNSSNVDDENDNYFEQFQAVNDEWLTDPDCTECEKESGEQDHVYMRYRNGYYDRDGYYTYDQVIKIIDQTPPAIYAPVLDTVLIITGAEFKNDTYEECVNSGTVMANALDVCGADQLIEDDRLVWSIVTRNEAGIVIAGPKQVIGSEADMTTGVGMAGTFHEIEWTVTDACGNTSRETTIVEFADGKNPTPVCISDLSTSSMNTDGTAEIWAKDFDRGSYDNCGTVKFLFLVDDNGDHSTDVSTGTFVPSITFQCEDLTAGQGGTINLDMYVTDDYGNYDFCMVRLRIDDNADACPDSDSGAALIAGALYTPDDDMVEEVEVSINEKSMMTKSDGVYGFNNSTIGGDYEVVPAKDGDDLNGISIIDIYALEHYILGIRNFDNAYQFVAADINNDEKISGLDLIELRKTVLGVTDGFLQNTSWRFIDATQEFAEISSPWPLKESIIVQDLQANTRDQNFIGVKIGDLNYSAVANSTKSKGRSRQVLELITDNQVVKAGEFFELKMSVDKAIDLSAFQLVIEHDNAELKSINSNALDITAEDYNRLDENVTMVSGYNIANAIALDPSNDLITLQFIANVDLSLDQSVRIAEAHLPSVAYDVKRNELNVELKFNSLSDLVFTLEQNHPNPFTDQTEIGFVLPEAGQATLTLFDATGKVLISMQDNFAKGRNTIQVSTEQLKGSNSVIYYQLESGDFLATKKMIRLQ